MVAEQRRPDTSRMSRFRNVAALENTAATVGWQL